MDKPRDQTLTFQPESDAPVTVDVAPPSAPTSTRYVEDRIIGRGGMGTVTLVRDENVGRMVALKQLNVERRDDAASLARFSREARLQGQLEHPAIVPVYDVGVLPDGSPFFTMKRVRGQSLAEILRAQRAGEPTKFSRRKLLTALSQLASAVHYAHERGVVHRDIKPSNIMLGSYGEVYLLDWGVAKLAGEGAEHDDDGGRIESPDDIHTGLGGVIGTVSTMAPEQAIGAAVDAQTDVYALGAVLFEMLTLEPLHPTGAFDDVVAAIAKGVEARPSVRRPDVEVPPELEALCVSATHLFPGDRLPSALALSEALDAYLDGDRDQELRLQSARRHADEARARAAAVLGDGDAAPAGEASGARTGALREVGRALALDPGNQDALATLVRLLTTPPRTPPPEVAREQEAEAMFHVKRGGLGAAIVYGYITLNAFVTWYLGVHDLQIFLTAHALWFLAFGFGVITFFRPSYLTLIASALFGMTTCVYTTAVYSPLLPLVPALLVAHATLFGFVRPPGLRRLVLTFATVAWAVAVYGASLGILPETVRFVGGDIVLHSPVISLDAHKIPTYVFASVLAMILAPGVFVGRLRSAFERTDAEMRLLAWQLRQLVTDRSGDEA
ncbi:MAG: serine/threonine-protein kinase [Polyangiaceae bacterium]